VPVSDEHGGQERIASRRLDLENRRRGRGGDPMPGSRPRSGAISL